MKITTLAKASVFTMALGLACLLPATAHAQSDAMPDYFPFSAEEAATQTAQPAVTKVAKADFEAKVSLPYGLNCAGKNLKPGEYSLSVKSQGASRVVTIQGSGQNVSMRVREVPANRGANQRALLVRKSTEGRRLEAVYLPDLNATLYLDSNTKGSDSGTEWLPIS
jgi:hypothetical protein